ncbi:MFS transporter [Amycolatopsis suaedae]|uniref:MFS transporter n=1 Tax=Amycolatopsis suaedae TaxID=2510978 RepID=A0A4V2ELC8_9PSEU|nr:MFS transporter [Amycolatopsis suaedae]RZQ61115.1 MFS transporter [Amycolatopsis suaedae]
MDTTQLAVRAGTPVAADPRRWKALVLLCTANFMVILDSQIVILGLPSIARDLGMTPAGAQWVIGANLVTFGGLLLLGGRASDLLGRRRMFIAGTALFVVVSLLSGLAWSAEVMVVARALHGVSAALMAPTALSILTTTFPEGAERNKALAGWSGVGGIGATAGLLVGGGLTSGLGWEWIFYVNVPVALVMLALAPVLLNESHDRERRRGYDVAGAVTSTAALVLIVYAVVEAPKAGWLSGQTIGLAAAAVALLVVFVAVERRSAAPLVPLRILRSPALVGGNLVTVLLGMLAVGLSVTISQYAQQLLGYTPLEFGVKQAVMPVMAFVGAYAGQAAVTRWGYRPVAAISVVLMGVGALLLTGVSPGGGYVQDILPGLLVFGPGLGAGTVAASAAALAGVAERESGLASGFNTAAFQIGGALGVAVVSTVMVAQAAGPDPAAAFPAAFTACVVFAAAGLALALLLLRRSARR